MANEFDEVLDQESAGARPPLNSGLEKSEFDDVLDSEVSQQQNYVRTVIDLASKDNPDAAAERIRLSQSTGLPPDVVARNQQELKRREIARAIDLQRMMRDSPVLFRQMTDPTFTAAAIDDLDTLRQIEKSFTNIADYAKSGEMASDAGGAARSLALGATVGVGKMIFDIFGAATDVVGLDSLSAGYRTMSDNARQSMEDFGMQADTATGRAVKSGLESAGQNIALLPLGLERGLFQTAEAAGAAVAGAMSAGVGADSYLRARGEGVGKINSALYGLNDAGVEFLMEKIPASKLFKGIELDNSLLKQFAEQAITEGWTEQVTTFAQDFNAWMALHPEKSAAEFLAERPEAAYQTFIATLIGTGVQTTAISGINKLVEKASDQALVYERDRLQRQLKLAGMSALRDRSPEQFRANMEQVIANAPEGAPTEIHVDAEVLNQLAPEVQALLPESVRAQIPEALELKTTVPISMADVLTVAPGTELEQALNDNGRIGSPDAPSRVEAEQAAEFIRDDAERVLQQAQDQSAWQQSVATVRQTVLDQLNQAGRFTADQNERYADLQSQMFSVMAARMKITPEELYSKFSLKVANTMGQGEVLNARPMSTSALLRKFGKQPANTDEASAALAAGDRVFVSHDIDEAPFEVKSVSVIQNYQPDQILVVSRFAGQDTVSQSRDIPNDPNILRQRGVQQAGKPIPSSVDAVSNVEASFQFAGEQQFPNNRDFKLAIQGRVLEAAKAAKVKLDEFTQGVEQYLVRIAVSDGQTALRTNANAVGWYNEKVTKALRLVSLIHPEISTDPKAKFAFVWAMAVTSNGLKVDKNFELAEKVYQGYKATGQMPTNIGIGTAAEAINRSLGLYNTLIAKHGFDVVERFMTTLQPAGEVEKFTGQKVTGENKTTMVYGAAALGPKIGNGFFMNLYGRFEQLTMDRWLMRTWGRWTGTLVESNPAQVKAKRIALKSLIQSLTPADKKAFEGIIKRKLTVGDIDAVGQAIWKASQKPFNRVAMAKIGIVDEAGQARLTEILGEPKKDKVRVSIGDELRKGGNALTKYLDGQKEAPAGPPERGNIRKVFGQALAELQKQYPALTMSDFQALLWYPEKRLYDAAKTADEAADAYEDDEAPDYANAAAKLARSQGVSDADISTTLATVDAELQAAVGAGGVRSGERGPGDRSGSAGQEVLTQSVRGTFNPQTLVISLGEQSDLSTFLHESGHFFLEVLADLASDPNAPQQVVDDFGTFLKWAGVPDAATWNGYTLDEKRTYHERWAESFEQYLLEGKAPSIETRGLFRTFRTWLMRVYTDLANFMRGRDLKVNDEIRQVFDRMLATDEEIKRAEEAAGLLPDFDGTNEAIERLQARKMRDLKWTLNARSKFLKQFTKEARELRKGVLAEVMAQFEQRNDAIASRAIRKVRNKEGAERDAKIAAIADATGYATVEEMQAAVDALGPVNEAIEAEVDRIMLERHAELATPEALEEAANEAVHNEAHARSLATELKSQQEMISARTDTGRTNVRGKPITVNALIEAANQFAKDLAARRRVKDLKKSAYQHRAAEARAGKAWTTATRKGETQEAVKAKRDQLLNNRAVSALVEAQAEVRSAIEFFRKVTKGNNEKLVKGGRDPDVVNAMRAILGAYGIAPRTGKSALEYMEIVQQNDPETAQALMPGVVNALSRAVPYTDLTMDELRGLRADLEAMWHLAKEKRQIVVDGVRMSIEDARDQLYNRLEVKGIPDKVPGQNSARTAEDKAAEKLRETRGNLTRVEQWSEGMDGQIDGPFTRILFRAIKIAADNYRASRSPVFKRLEAATKAVAPFIQRAPISAPRLNYVFGLGDGHNNTGMAELLAALLNTGNESNLRKLLLGGRPNNPWATENPDGTLDTSKWDATIADLVADGTLRKEHFDYVQAVWDVLESLKPLAQESHRRVYGRYFSEVTAKPFVDPFGIQRKGGYYPAKVDPALVPDGKLRDLARQENESMEFSFPSAPSGWSKSRVENYTRPLLLDVNLMYRHIDEVLLFSHMQPSVNAVNRLLRDKKLSYALARVSPEAYGSILTPWLAGAARQIVETQVPSDGGFNKAASMLRSRTGLQLMIANLSNASQQITGAFTAAAKLEADQMERGAMIKAAAKWVANPIAFRNAVWELSSYMKDRSENETASLLDTMRDIMFNPTLLQKGQTLSRRHGYFMQVLFDNTLSPVVWSAAYSAYLNKLPKVDTSGMSASEVEALLNRQNRDAVLYADGLVRQTQGSNLPEDISRFERGTGFLRFFNQFAGYFNMQANTNASSIVKLAEQGGLKKNSGRGFYILMMGLLMPIWVAETIALAFKGGPDDEDDDGEIWDDWLRSVFGMGTFKGMVAMVPGAGPVISAAVNRVATNTPADDRVSVSPVFSILESAVGGNVYTGYQLVAGKEVNAQRAVKDLAMLIGLATGLPAYALARPLGYAAGVAQGKVEPTGPVDAARGVITGTASPESKQR